MVFLKRRFLCKIHKAPSLSLEWFIFFSLCYSCMWTSAKGMGEIQSIKIPIFLCHSAIHWVGCMFKEKIPRSNISSACMLSFTFHIVAGKNYSSWQISDVHRSRIHFKNRICQLSVQAKNPVSVLTLRTQAVTPRNQTLFWFLSLSHFHYVWSTFTDTNCPGSTICPCLFCLILCTVKPNWLNAQLQSEFIYGQDSGKGL